MVGSAIDRYPTRAPKAEAAQFGSLHAIRNKASEPWVILSHPLWDRENPQGVLKDALEKAPEGTEIVDSFTLTRRPSEVNKALRGLTRGTAATLSAAGDPVVDIGQLDGAVANYQPEGVGFTLDLAWPDAPSNPVCFLLFENREREVQLEAAGWAIFGPGDEAKLTAYLDR